MANLFRILHAKFYQNRPRFKEDMTKTFRLTLFMDMVYVSAASGVINEYNSSSTKPAVLQTAQRVKMEHKRA